MKRRIDLMLRWLLPVAVAYAVATTLLYWFGFFHDDGPLSDLWLVLMFPASVLYVFLLLCLELLFLVPGVPEPPTWLPTILTAALLIAGLVQGLIWCLAVLGLLSACRRVRAALSR